VSAAANPPQSNPAAQISWMISYSQGRYGSPEAAEQHEISQHWYDKGGILPPGLTLAANATGKNEVVLPWTDVTTFTTGISRLPAPLLALIVAVRGLTTATTASAAAAKTAAATAPNVAAAAAVKAAAHPAAKPPSLTAIAAMITADKAHAGVLRNQITVISALLAKAPKGSPEAKVLEGIFKSLEGQLKSNIAATFKLIAEQAAATKQQAKIRTEVAADKAHAAVLRNEIGVVQALLKAAPKGSSETKVLQAVFKSLEGQLQANIKATLALVKQEQHAPAAIAKGPGSAPVSTVTVRQGAPPVAYTQTVADTAAEHDLKQIITALASQYASLQVELRLLADLVAVEKQAPRAIGDAVGAVINAAARAAATAQRYTKN
jgi:hypothetical protein